MLKQSKVVGFSVPLEQMQIVRFAQAKAKRLGLPFYKVMIALMAEYIREEQNELEPATPFHR